MTKNTKLYLIGLVLIAVISTTTVIGVGMLVTTRQPTPNPVPKTKAISAADNGTTVIIQKGDFLQLTLKNYGDGGYSWTIKNQDSIKLALSSQNHINGSGALGDFGSDLWTFTALQPGTSSLELVCARPWNTSDICATFNIQVVIQ